MESDSDVLITNCLKLYVKGMRRVVSERLQEVFGDEWWQRGILGSFDKERGQRLKDEARRSPNRDLALGLDAPHFPPIIKVHLDQAFHNVFVNRFDALNQMWDVVQVRNSWAHQQEIPFPLALRAAGEMRGVLLELKCSEALEIENLIKDYAIEPMVVAEVQAMYNVEMPIDADDLPELQEGVSSPVALWRELQRHLRVETHVEIPEDMERETATVTLFVRNTAPMGRDLPEVYFRNIAVVSVGGNARRRGNREITGLGPGDAEEMQFAFPARQVLSVNFEVTGEVDAERYFRFATDVGLPKDVLEPLRQEFIEWLDALQLKAFVDGVETEVTGLNDQMPMAEIRSRRTALGQRATELQRKQNELQELYSHFKLRGGSTLADRIKELAHDMIEFGERLKELDEAMGETDMEKIEAAVHGIREVHLSLLRVEAVVRSASET